MVTFSATGTGATGDIQEFVIPRMGLYEINAYGAWGGLPLGVADAHRGRGARVTGMFFFGGGETVRIVVGQAGTVNTTGNNANGGGCGGGGSFVWADGASQPLVAAGGGGGGSITNTGYDIEKTKGRGGNDQPDGLPSWGINLLNYGTDGGDATYSAGARGWDSMVAALDFSGGAGNYGGLGGFGGGGNGADGSHGGGGGGGYSGGGGGYYGQNNGGNADGRDGGGGGGSFVSPDANNTAIAAGVNEGDGLVEIAYLGSGEPSDASGLWEVRDIANIAQENDWPSTEQPVAGARSILGAHLLPSSSRARGKWDLRSQREARNSDAWPFVALPSPRNPYLDFITSEAPTAYWPLRGASGREVTGAYPGRIEGEPVSDESTPLLDEEGASLLFDGVDDALASDLQDSPPTNTFTMEAWLLPSASIEVDGQSNSGYAGTTGQRYFWDPQNRQTDAGAGLAVGTNFVGVYEHGNSYMPCTLSHAGTFLSWIHVVVVYQDRVPSLYINGQFVKSGVVSARTTVYAPASLGGGQASYGYYQGLACEAVVYGRALTEQEVLDHYNKAFEPLPPHEPRWEPTLLGETVIEDGASLFFRFNEALNASQFVDEVVGEVATPVGGVVAGEGGALQNSHEDHLTSIRFDGTGHVSIPAPASLSEVFAYELWFKVDAVTGDTSVRQYLFTLQQDPPTVASYTYIQRHGVFMAGNKLQAQIYVGDSASPTLLQSPILSPQEWYHVVLAGGGFGTRLYVNANLVATGETPPVAASVNEFLLGRRMDAQGDDYLTGGIDEFAAYFGTFLTHDQVTDHYRTGVGWDKSPYVIPLQFAATSTGQSGTVQEWTVPESGSYEITAVGASGGGAMDKRGRGALIRTHVGLSKGDVLKIVAGQRGGQNTSAGGGGGSFVWRGDGADAELLVAAGGGGGVYTDSAAFSASMDASVDTSGNDGAAGMGGADGQGGTTTGAGSAGWGGAGAGWLSDGQDAVNLANTGGHTRTNGFTGGGTATTAVGGFGGGGGTHGNSGGGGGGGGYSGGGGGNQADGNGAGGGGGSYALGTVIDAVVGSGEDHGYVQIRAL